MTYNTINDAVTMQEGAEGALLSGRYRIVRQLGQGGMGSVWLVADTQLDNKQFAIKMLPSILVSNKRAYRQLKDEALVAMKLVHPNIVTLRAFEENNGNPFLVMDYIDGETLDDYLAEKGNLSEDETVKLLKPIAAALDYAHSKGVVHRDVKPGNVMVAKDGATYILDFGIAREVQETMTRVTGKLSSGTLLYMSPEQLRGQPPKAAQDVYSFAAMVYECLKGEPPFSRGQVEYQILNEQPETLPDGIRSSATVMRGLSKTPENRPPDCVAVFGVVQRRMSSGLQRTRISLAKTPKTVSRQACLPAAVSPGPVDADGVREPIRPAQGSASSAGQHDKSTLSGAWLPVIGVAIVLFVFVVIALTRSGRSRSSGHEGAGNSPVENGAGAGSAGDSSGQEPARLEEGVRGVRRNAWEARKAAIWANAREFAATSFKTGEGYWIAATNSAARAVTVSEHLAVSNLFVLCEAEFKKSNDKAKEVSRTRGDVDVKRNAAAVAKKSAAGAGAERYATAVWKEAERLRQEADACWNAGRIADAAQKFELAARKYNLARGDADGVKSAAERSYANALKSSSIAEKAGAKRRLPVEWNKALASWKLGKDELNKDYVAARAAFDEAQRQYDKCALLARKIEQAYKLFDEGNYSRLVSEFSGEAADFPDVAYLLGMVYDYGLTSLYDRQRAVRLFEVAAKSGHPLGCAELGTILVGGKGGIKKDEARGNRLARKSVARLVEMANEGEYLAQMALGDLYWDGVGCESNRVVAVNWYCRAKDRCLRDARKGISFAQTLAGDCLFLGRWGAIDKAQAFKWYDKAARQECISAMADVGAMYFAGDGVVRDYHKAVWFLRKPSEQGVDVAQTILGRAYEEGWGVGKNYGEALRLYRKAAGQGCAVAIHNLGGMYWNGTGVKQDYFEAVTWFRQSAELGDLDSQNILGRAYEEGWGVSKNIGEALRWYRKAAEQGHAIAQNNLGLMYEYGKGVSKNRATAVMWLRKAAAQGCDLARNNLKELGYRYD